MTQFRSKLNLKLYHFPIKDWILKIEYDVIGFTVIIGIVIHLFFMANQYVNHDSVVTYYNNNSWLLTQGKWFVTPLASFDSPSVNIVYSAGIIGLIAISLSSYIFCCIFNLHSKWVKKLVGISFVSFPAITACFLYQSLDFFGLTFLLTMVSAYFLVKRKGIIPTLAGLGFLTLSLGAYQAYLGAAIAIMVLDCLMKAIRNKSWKSILCTGVKYCLYIVLAIGLYYIILRIRLAQTKMELSSYKGINNMTDYIKPYVLLRSVKYAMLDVYNFFMKNCFGVVFRGFSWLNLVFILLTIISILIIMINSGAIHSIMNIIITIAMLMCLPVAVNIIGVLSANQTFYYISIIPFVMLYISPIILVYEGLEISEWKSNVKEVNTKQLIFLALVVLIAVNSVDWIGQDNIVYQKIALMNKEYDSKLSILATRIQSMPGYNQDTKVVFVGKAPYDFLKSSGKLTALEVLMDTHAFGLYKAEDIFYSEGIIAGYYNNVLSLPLNQISSEQISEKNAIEAMPVYPYDGSIVMKDDVIIVKLSDNI